MSRVTVHFIKLHPEVPDPAWGTVFANCFDLHFFSTTMAVQGYSAGSEPFHREVHGNTLRIMPGDRVLVPTGLIFRLEDHLNGPTCNLSIRLHPRSGLAYKKGLTLANCEGIVDIDYNQQTYVLMTNIGTTPQVIRRGDRICQAEVCVNEKIKLVKSDLRNFVSLETDRSGGFGSTGE